MRDDRAHLHSQEMLSGPKVPSAEGPPVSSSKRKDCSVHRVGRHSDAGERSRALYFPDAIAMKDSFGSRKCSHAPTVPAEGSPFGLNSVENLSRKIRRPINPLSRKARKLRE